MESQPKSEPENKPESEPENRPESQPESQPDLTDRLYAAWQQAVLANKLINEFIAAADDGEGRWRAGDRIAFGLKYQANQTVYYAQNLTQARPIQGAVEEKTIDGLNFICQFNGYRALRPGGSPKPVGRQPDLSPDPAQCRFSCQNREDPLSLLVRSPLLQLPLTHFTWRAYYNAAPIEPNGHFLWVPTASTAPSDTLTHFPQVLTLAFLEDAISLFKQFRHTALFFNSLHSGASVNHIHFQAIAYRQPLPAETWPLAQPVIKPDLQRDLQRDPNASDYAKLAGYPAQVMVFSQLGSTLEMAKKVFYWINRLQQRDIPFNLMLVGDRIILIPRNIEHEIVSEFGGNGIAALGMCGKIITVDRTAYLNANKQTIEQAFGKMVLLFI